MESDLISLPFYYIMHTKECLQKRMYNLENNKDSNICDFTTQSKKGTIATFPIASHISLGVSKPNSLPPFWRDHYPNFSNH